jgi:hypothetical protein
MTCNFQLRERESDEMQPVPSEKPSPWPETLAGVFIFIQFPLLYYFSRSIFPAVFSPGATSWLALLAGVFLFFSLWFLIPLLGFAIGWLRGFPRWVYPYVGFSILVSLYLMNAGTPGIMLFGIPIFGRELWGIRACLPGLLMAGIVLALTRSPRSLLVFFENGWKDWTCFSFALFGIMPLVNFIAFDEIADAYKLPFQIGLVVIMVLAAAAYLRSTSATGRVLSLVAGFSLCVLVDSIAPTLYWLESGGVYITGMVIFAVSFLIVVFLPALIGLFRHFSIPKSRMPL